HIGVEKNANSQNAMEFFQMIPKCVIQEEHVMSPIYVLVTIQHNGQDQTVKHQFVSQSKQIMKQFALQEELAQILKLVFVMNHQIGVEINVNSQNVLEYFQQMEMFVHHMEVVLHQIHVLVLQAILEMNVNYLFAMEEMHLILKFVHLLENVVHQIIVFALQDIQEMNVNLKHVLEKIQMIQLYVHQGAHALNQIIVSVSLDTVEMNVNLLFVLER